MRIMREYPSLISRRGDIQVLPCASLRTGLALRKNKEFSPGSKTKDQVLQDTLRSSRDEKRAEINRWPQLMLPNTLLLKSSSFIFEFIQAHFGQCFPERAQKAESSVGSTQPGDGHVNSPPALSTSLQRLLWVFFFAPFLFNKGIISLQFR